METKLFIDGNSRVGEAIAKTSDEIYIEVLQQKITTLENKLKIAEEALGFYGNEKHWNIVEDYNGDTETGVITLNDQCKIPECFLFYEIGGKRARQALAKIREE